MPGKVLFLSAILSEGDVESSTVTREALERTGLREAAIVILEARERGYDAVEIHFAGAGTHVQALLASMGPAMSRCWRSRLPGTASALAERTRLRPVTAQRPTAADLLSPNNPAGLSRSEFRICALMREGLPTKQIARELAIRPTTLRAHLQSIYAKTGATGQVELVHRLAQGGRPAAPNAVQITSRLV
jgi:DNA-binding CsgD family transcriptional regulator